MSPTPTWLPPSAQKRYEQKMIITINLLLLQLHERRVGKFYELLIYKSSSTIFKLVVYTYCYVFLMIFYI